MIIKSLLKPDERRVLLASLRAQREILERRANHLEEQVRRSGVDNIAFMAPEHPNKQTFLNVMEDLSTTKKLIATLQ